MQLGHYPIPIVQLLDGPGLARAWTRVGFNTSSVTPRSPTRSDMRRCRPSRSKTSRSSSVRHACGEGMGRLSHYVGTQPSSGPRKFFGSTTLRIRPCCTVSFWDRSATLTYYSQVDQAERRGLWRNGVTPLQTQWRCPYGPQIGCALRQRQDRPSLFSV